MCKVVSILIAFANLWRRDANMPQKPMHEDGR